MDPEEFKEKIPAWSPVRQTKRASRRDPGFCTPPGFHPPGRAGSKREAVAERTLLSIVVPTKNRPQSLRRLLESLQRQDYQPYEVIVVDDASDAPVSGLNGVSVIRREVSGGCGPARNDGIAAAHGAFIASFDDDCEITDPVS
jgi:cellulose synthase/poly-beta-1,6-N-acetylglucosamine synthase-like glycosyltransferase